MICKLPVSSSKSSLYSKESRKLWVHLSASTYYNTLPGNITTGRDLCVLPILHTPQRDYLYVVMRPLLLVNKAVCLGKKVPSKDHVLKGFFPFGYIQKSGSFNRETLF